MPARQTPQSSTTNTTAGSYTNDTGRRSSRRIASRAPAPAPLPTSAPTPARTTAAPVAKRAAPASRSRAPASGNRGPETRAAPANAGKRKRAAANDDDEEEERPLKRKAATKAVEPKKATKAVEPKKGNKDAAQKGKKDGAPQKGKKEDEPKKGKKEGAPKKRKRGAADDEDEEGEEKEGEEEGERPKKRKTAKGGEHQGEKDEQQGKEGKQKGKKDGQRGKEDEQQSKKGEASKKRKRALDDDEEDGEKDEEKECPKKQKTGGKDQRKASAAGKAGTAKKAAATRKVAATTEKASATKRTAATKKTAATTKTAATKKASRKSTKINTNTNTTIPTARLGQRAPETRDDGEGPSSTPSSAPAQDHPPQHAQDHTPQPAQNHIQRPIASTPRPKSPPRRLTSIPPPEAWGPDRTASRPKHPYITPPPVFPGCCAPPHPTHTPEGLPICFPQPFNDPIPDTIPEQTYEATLPFPGAADYGYAPLGQRTHDRGLQRQHATFLPRPASECTGPSAPPPQPLILPEVPYPAPCRNILMPTPWLPSQPGPDWLVDPTGLRARSPRGSHYRWYERRLHDYIPDWNVMPLWSAYQRQKHANYKLFVQGRLTFFKHRPVDESEEEVRFGEYVPYTRQPLRRHEQLVQFGWVKLDGEEAREAECSWEQWRPRPVASTSRLPEASPSELPEASSSRLPEPRVADAEIEKCDTDIEEEVEEEVTYVGKGKGRAL